MFCWVTLAHNNLDILFLCHMTQKDIQPKLFKRCSSEYYVIITLGRDQENTIKVSSFELKVIFVANKANVICYHNHIYQQLEMQ